MGLERVVPLEAFEHLDQGVLITDELGRVKLCNHAAGSLIGYDPEAAVGERCWKVARLRTTGGIPYCSSDCAIQKGLREGDFHPCSRVLRGYQEHPAFNLHVCTIPIPPPIDGRHAVIHLITTEGMVGEAIDRSEMHSADGHRRNAERNGPIGTVAESETHATTAMSALEHSAEGLTLLSRREEEVLELMAEGLATGEIAERLAICPTTVRNHVQRILEKLSVHKRLPAVLIWMLGHR